MNVTLSLDANDVAYLVALLRVHETTAHERAARFPAARAQANRDHRLIAEVVTQAKAATVVESTSPSAVAPARVIVIGAASASGRTTTQRATRSRTNRSARR